MRGGKRVERHPTELERVRRHGSGNACLHHLHPRVEARLREEAEILRVEPLRGGFERRVDDVDVRAVCARPGVPAAPVTEAPTIAAAARARVNFMRWELPQGGEAPPT